MENNYISRQISVYKTNKKLVEFIDKLRPANINHYAHIHASGEEINGKKQYSLIGIVLQDYSRGTGNNTVRVTANLSVDDICYIHSKLLLGVPSFKFEQDKIFGVPNEHGRSMVTKVRLVRAEVGSDGKPRNYPWYIEVDNGTGVAEKAKTGGTYIGRNSFSSMNKVFANLNDADFFALINRAVSFIKLWENAYGPPIISQGVEEIQRNIQNRSNY